MKKFSKVNKLLSVLIIFSLFQLSLNQTTTRINPEDFKKGDLFFEINDNYENDKLNAYNYNLIDAKVLTNEEINLYIKKQGIHLKRDECCKNNATFIAYNLIKSESDYEEIYSNTKYRPSNSQIEYKFPVDKLENIGYSLYHRVWIFNTETASRTLSVKLRYNNPALNLKTIVSNYNMAQRTKLFELQITCKSDNQASVISYINYVETNLQTLSDSDKKLDDGISSIIFEFNSSPSPAIAMHWTFLKIIISLSNFSFKGNSLCDRITNPCISGYYCSGGICKRCHPSCFDCVNGGLSTDCYSRCNTHAVTPTPEKGSCSIGYVDLNQFEDFKIENMVPPPRNNRLTISFWMFISDFPSKDITAYLNNNFYEDINIEFKFIENTLKIKCVNKESKSFDSNNLNTWIYVKCAISLEKQNYRYLYIKPANANTTDIYSYSRPTPDLTAYECKNDHHFKKYYEPDDYITLEFLNFNKLQNDERTCHFYMKQLVIFREYLPEPYDNKYFNMEKLTTGNTIELPELLFIIPFDELIRENNLYKIKAYSYPGNVEVKDIILNPKESESKFTLYPPKQFKRLYLLDKNKKYDSTDLLEITDLDLGDNFLIASYDKVPLSCEDSYYLNFDLTSFNDNDPSSYKGDCLQNCPLDKSKLFGLGETKGFCNRDCNNAYDANTTVCLYNGTLLLNLKENFECKNNYYNMFYYCQFDDKNKDNNVFYYDPNYSPANIVLDLRMYNLKSYIIEFWYFTNECKQVTSGYIFYSDQIQLKKVETSYNAYTTAHDIRTDFTINEGYWNQIVLEVYYDPRADRNYKTLVYLQTNYNSGNALEIDNSENDYKLNYIYFCNGRRASCNNLELNWYCGFYRKLRVFNGNMAQRHVTFRYDDLYPEFLVSSIILYLPLYGKYIANNKLTQYIYNDIEFLAPFTTTLGSNTWNLPQYNYCSKKAETCGITNCNDCFDQSSNCFGCSNGFLDRKETNNVFKTECITSGQYVLSLPPAPKSIILDETENYEGITVNFFIKLYGFKTQGEIDIVTLGDNLKLSYNSNPDDKYFGLNLKYYLGSSESSEEVISNYYDFRKHFGLWTFISIATFNETYKTYFPAMVRFEVNQKKMPVVGPLEHLTISYITFSDNIYALVQRIKIYQTYIIGAHAFETNGGDITSINENIDNFKKQALFLPQSQSDCEYENGGGNKCVIEKDDDLLEKSSGLNAFNLIINEIKLKKDESCNTNCDICFGASEFNCSCNFLNNNEKIFLGNVSNHYCKQLNYINFAKAKKVEIQVPNVGNQYSLHFWFYAHSYIENVFEGLSVEWENQLKIEVKLDSTNRYNYICYVGNTQTNPIEIKMDTWNFIHCAADYDEGQIYFTTEEDDFNVVLSGTKTTDSGNTNLVIQDLTDDNIKGWGILFYKYIRLWKKALKSSSFLSRIEIDSSFSYDSLLQQWHTVFNTDHNMIETIRGILKKEVEYYTGDNEKIGTNIIPEDIYNDMNLKPTLCNKTGQYYDRKTEKCVDFIELSDITTDINIDEIDVAYSHNYGIAFWILMEDHKAIENSIDIIWQYHMRISLEYDNNNGNDVFKVYCFPQNYEPYSKIIEDSTSLDDATQDILNSATNEYERDLKGEWLWIQCSLSYNNRYYYLNEHSETLISETLYKYNGQEIKNDEPLGYFYNAVNDKTLSKLTIKINSNGSAKKVYLRCLYLFKDYLPYNYNFRYMDMYRIDKEEFPPLALAINFAEFDDKDIAQNKIIFKYRTYTSLENIMKQLELPLEFNTNPKKQLSENFIFLPLCNITGKEKYNSDKNLCEKIDNCDPNALNCLYCMDENMPLVCKSNYYINIDDARETVECLNYCKGNFYRSPGTFPTQGICGTDCISFDYLLTCPNSAASILSYQSDFQCKTGFYRIGYQCFEAPIDDKENKGALFYSGVNYPYNIYQSFTNDFITLIGNGYVLEFWFMIDSVIYSPDKFVTDKPYYYFYSKPHEIYVKKDSAGALSYWYNFNQEEKIDITSLIHPYEWNKILIFADATISGIKQVRVLVNFDKEHIESRNVVKDLTLTYIAFCSKDPDLLFPLCVVDGNDIKWASAFYNNIRIWNIYTSTIDTIQSFNNGIYKEYPQSIILYYPLTIQYLDNNRMTNIMGNLEEHITIKCDNGAKCALYNKDNIIIYNYSSKFDWGLGHNGSFVESIDGDNNIIGKTCDPNCLRCFEENNIENCYECKPGYVLQYKVCKKAEEYYFMKTPSGGIAAPINFVLDNEQGNSITSLKGFTIVFWMKFFGVPYATITEYCSILSLDSNTYLAFHRSTNNLVLLENSKIVFRDTNFGKYFGIWIPISIADYISNEQNDIYPNMFTLSVNKIDIPFSEGYSLPSTGIKINQLQFGYEIIALFAELNIYSKFIQGGYGKIRSTIFAENLFYSKSLTGTSTSNCVNPSTDLISSVNIICSPDYSLNFIRNANGGFCDNDLQYFEPYDENNEEKLDDADRCQDCDELCNTLCFNSGEESCTCDLTEGIFWLRRNLNMQTYCEHIPYFDFGNINEYAYTNAPMSKTKEYTIEFWLFVYSYNLVTMNFKSMYLEWNFHNRLRIYNEQNSLKVNCQPIWRDYDFVVTNYPDDKQSSLKYYQWNYVRCGTDLKNKKYFLNTITEYDLKTKPEFFFDLKQENIDQPSNNKYFRIYRSSDFLVNFGYVFIRELKLWQQYNLDFLDSQYIYFDLSKTNVEYIKTNFPGLLLYYKNEFNLNEQNNPIITEILSNTSTIIGRDPNYVGYNIVDPNRMGYAELLQICPLGKVYNELRSLDTYKDKCECPKYFKENDDGDCEVEEETEEESSLCQVYSNSGKNCLQCKDDNKYLNKWINEFEEKCYYDCPVTLFEDPLMNQCRRCHETCYECTNETAYDCTSCTGELYFNFKENTCISNCQTAGLTRSLTRPNLCVIFDADASLVNVDTLTPIDVNNFNYIEAKIINPTSPEYKTLWLFDAEKTNAINQELGFNDPININSNPFTGDLTQVKVTLNTKFFKIKHQYVFGMKIYVINEGVEVPIYVWWTLTMNAPPFGGQLIVMPYLGLYNTTTFIMRCVDFLDENTPAEDIEFDFYYIEVNTNSKIKLTQDFSLVNEVYSNFTVRYYQLDYSNITIYCQARDKFGAISEASNVITIVNQKSSPLYNLKQILSTFYIVDDPLTDIQLLARAEVLMSLGINPYTTNVPEKFFTTYESSLTGEKVEMTDPPCITGYCNGNGECQVIDVAMTCNCEAGYLGKECFLDKDGYTDLSYYYKKLYQRLIDRLTQAGTGINDMVFNAFYKLFFAAQKFFQEESFFQANMIEFKNYLLEEKDYITLNEDRINKIFDLNEFFFNYFYIRENKLKLQNKINENFPFRNRTLTVSEYSIYQTAFQKFFSMIDEDTVFLIKNWGEEYIYQTEHFSYYLLRIDQNFDDAGFFESLKTVWVTYKPIVLFMECLKEKYDSFDYFFNYVEYAVNPLSYEGQFYPNITSPLISIKIYDNRGNEIPIRNCPSNKMIKIQLPFNSYDWINYINEQKWLFLPENYKIETDPVFRDPILIWDNGSVSDDTVQERILKYYRYYNIVGLVYTPNSLSLYEYTSFLFKNISDTFLLMFETNHFSAFTSMLIPNIMNFVVDGRFYYLPRYEVLFCFDNHLHNPVFYIWLSLLVLFILISIFFIFYDYKYFDNLEILDFLKKEIVKVHFPYGQLKFGLNDENIYKLIPKESKLKKGSNRPFRKMFKDYDLGDIQENNEENEDNENNNNIETIYNEDDKKNNTKLNKKFTEIENTYSTTRNRLTTKAENINEDNVEEKKTELRTNKKIKIKNKNKNKDNPPKKKRYKITDNINTLTDNFSTKSKTQKAQKVNSKESLNQKEEEEDQKIEEKGYGQGDADEDFNENIIEENLDSEKNTPSSNFGDKMSKFTTSSKNSLKKYYYGKYATKANLVSLQRFHNKAGRTNVDNDGIPLDIINEEEEREKALVAFTRLSVSTFVFFSYNLKVRHILVAPFLNLTLFNNRWKKLMVLLTQFYIQQLVISFLLTMRENITMSNILGIIVVAIIASFISDIIVYLFVFLFQSSNYQRKRLYRLVMMGENFTVTKAWNKLKRQMNFKLFIGFIIVLAIWAINFYLTLIFTSVWKYQRSAWITCFFVSLIIDLVFGEILVEGFCAFCFSRRTKSEFMKILGEGLNRLRAYRTMWP